MNHRSAVLLDTNVVVAALAEVHEHHEYSIALFASERKGGKFAVGAHSYAEAYAVLTRRAPASPFRWPAEDAWTALESMAAATSLVGLTHGQTFDAIREYALGGGIGSRLYDKLIGEVALRNGIGTVLTWNSRHMSGLFPALTISDPKTYEQASKS